MEQSCFNNYICQRKTSVVVPCDPQSLLLDRQSGQVYLIAVCKSILSTTWSPNLPKTVFLDSVLGTLYFSRYLFPFKPNIVHSSTVKIHLLMSEHRGIRTSTCGALRCWGPSRACWGSAGCGEVQQAPAAGPCWPSGRRRRGSGPRPKAGLGAPGSASTWAHWTAASGRLGEQ